MIHALLIHSGGRSEWVQPDGASVAWAELTMGAHFEDIPDYCLRLVLAYYYHQHRQGAEPVTWDTVHAWAKASGVAVTLPSTD